MANIHRVDAGNPDQSLAYRCRMVSVSECVCPFMSYFSELPYDCISLVKDDRVKVTEVHGLCAARNILDRQAQVVKSTGPVEYPFVHQDLYAAWLHAGYYKRVCDWPNQRFRTCIQSSLVEQNKLILLNGVWLFRINLLPCAVHGNLWTAIKSMIHEFFDFITVHRFYLYIFTWFSIGAGGGTKIPFRRYQKQGFWIKVFSSLAYSMFVCIFSPGDTTGLFHPERIQYLQSWSLKSFNLYLLFISGKIRRWHYWQYQ